MKKSLRIEVHKKCDEHCAYCGKKIEYKDMQVDHFYPQRAFRMDDKRKNHIDNLMPSCRRCNHYKRSEYIDGFRRSMKTLHERIEKIYINKVGIDYGVIIIEPFDGEFYFEKIGIEIPKHMHPLKRIV